MCGIFGIINNIQPSDMVLNQFMKGKDRGPELSVLNQHDEIIFGFHRLAINGLNEKSNQPLEIDNIILICNGEIYNFSELAKENNIKMETDSDCEIIIHMYKLYAPTLILYMHRICVDVYCIHMSIICIYEYSGKFYSSLLMRGAINAETRVFCFACLSYYRPSEKDTKKKPIR